MVARVNRQILLKSRPEGAPNLDNFTLKQGSVPEPGDGEVLMRTRWLSLDPYMRGRMSSAKSYAKPVEVGATMVGGTVGEVVASRNPNFAVGDIVMGYGGWQDYPRKPNSFLWKMPTRKRGARRSQAGSPKRRMRSSPMTKASTIPPSSKRARKRTPMSPRSSAAASRTRKGLEIDRKAATDCLLGTVARFGGRRRC
jgi:hypothetical protein